MINHVLMSTASLYRLRHQRQASDPLHAPGQAVFSVQDVEVCSVHPFRILHPDHDCRQYGGPHDEGKTSDVTCGVISNNEVSVPFSQNNFKITDFMI